MSAVLPQNFGRYQAIEQIGSGSIGTVYRAEDPLIGRPVAIKVIRTAGLDVAGRADYLERFGIEAKAGGRCSHPSIVAIHDAGEMAGEPFLVMEFVTGKTLQAILADTGARGGLDVMRVMQDVLDALGHAHSQGVVHRDIKPANIMITPSGRAKITDFGIARLEQSQTTHAGEMLGTPNYMAPEQVLGTPVDQRSDLFSAAAVLHTMLTGKPPFAGRSMADTLLRLTDAAPADLSLLASGPYAPYAPMLAQGLAKDRERRFASAQAFAAALRAAARHEPSDADTTIAATFAAAAQPAIGPALIERCVAQLARYLGPIAKLHVHKAARLARDEAALIAELARGIPNPLDAQKFLHSFEQIGQAGAPPPAQNPSGIPPEHAEAARAILASYTGPIAKLLIAQAIREASSLEVMVERLTQSIPHPEQATMLRRKLYAALSGGGSADG